MSKFEEQKRELRSRLNPHHNTSLIDPEWQPIETAPRDGTSIMIFSKFFHLPIVASGHMKHGIFYWLGVFSGQGLPDDAFSHWMPLPKPPVDNNK